MWLLRHAGLLRNRPVEFFHSIVREFGPDAVFRMGETAFHLVHSPERIQEILVTRAAEFEKFPRISRSQGLFGDGLLTSEEPRHLRQRRLMQPAFHRDRIAAYARTMVRCAEMTAASWHAGQTVDVAQSMNHLALDIVSRTLFSSETTEDATRIGEALEVVLHTLNRLMLPPGPWLLSLPLPSTLRYRKALQTLDEIVYRMIHARRVSGGPEDDLLGLLIRAEDQETGQRMTDLELRDEVMTLFVAGHDTTANALTWTWHLLAQHPEAMNRVAEESRSVLGDRSATAEDYPALTLTERVLAEAMRLYPPVWILGRRSLSEPNSVYLVCMYVLHRRPELYPDPNRFDPDRFLPENRDGRHKYGYMPFGAGSRLCIGERFAWMETVLAVATIARRWRLLPTRAEPVEPLALLTLRPKLGLHLRAEPQS